MHLRLDEFKGRRPIRRGSLEIPTATRLFDNPLGAKHIQVQSGGSRSTGTRVYVDLDQYGNDAEYEALFWGAAELHGRPLALWRPAPPFSAGLSICMRHSRIGQMPRQWFAQSVPSLDRSGWRHRLVLELLLATSRWHGRPVPRPRRTPTDAADRVAKWLAAAKRDGQPADPEHSRVGWRARRDCGTRARARHLRHAVRARRRAAHGRPTPDDVRCRLHRRRPLLDGRGRQDRQTLPGRLRSGRRPSAAGQDRADPPAARHAGRHDGAGELLYDAQLGHRQAADQCRER